MGRFRLRWRSRSSWYLGWGGVLVLAGLVLLGGVAWQYFGTTWVAQREHHRVVDALDESWREGRAVAGTGSGTARAVVRIPAFGDDYAVPLLDGAEDEQLASGFGWLEHTAEPGARGNFVVAGHRVTQGEPLRRMPDLRVGDEVVVETRDTVYTYVLDTEGDALSVDLSADWVLDERPRNPVDGGPAPARASRLLTLVTCASLFETDDRLVAFGHLVGAEPRAS